MSVSHIAGLVIVLYGNHPGCSGRIIQRCAVCGFKLIDARPENCLVPVGQDTTFPTYPPHAVVQFDGNMRVTTPIDPTATPEKPAKLPDDCCIDLVEPGDD